MPGRIRRPGRGAPSDDGPRRPRPPRSGRGPDFSDPPPPGGAPGAPDLLGPGADPRHGPGPYDDPRFVGNGRPADGGIRPNNGPRFGNGPGFANDPRAAGPPRRPGPPGRPAGPNPYGPPGPYDHPGPYDAPGSLNGPGSFNRRGPHGGPAPYDDLDPYDDPSASHAQGGEGPPSRRSRSAQRLLGSIGSRLPRSGNGPPGASRRGAGRLGPFPPVAYFAAAGVVIVIVIVAATAVLVSGGDDGGYQGVTRTSHIKGVRTEGSSAYAYSQAASTSVFAEIADRAKDDKPLSAAAAFDTKKITDDDAKASLKLTASSLVRHCTAAVWGERFAARLQQGGCTQVARAAYEDKRFESLVTIFNLANDRAADQVVADADPKAANGFPLVPDKATPFDQGFSIARGVAMGHYAVITWVRRIDGGGDERDAALLSLLVTTGRPTAILVRAARQEQHH